MANTFTDPTKEIESKQIVLYAAKYAQSMGIGSYTRDSIEIRDEPTQMFDSMIRTICMGVLEHNIHMDRYTTEFDYAYPKTAWQMFKRDHLPLWFRNKFPIQFEKKHAEKIVEFTRKATYPMADVSIPNNRFGPVVFRDVANVVGMSVTSVTNND